MNTINTYHSSLTLRNQPQTSEPTQQKILYPSFKGAMGDKLVKQIVNKEKLTAASIIALMGGILGLSKDKVKDVTESFMAKIQNLLAENESLNQQVQDFQTKANKEIADVKERAKQKELEMTRALSEIKEQKDAEIRAKDNEIIAKNVRIAELEKYADAIKIKSVDELDIVTPKEFLETIAKIKEAQPKAEESLLNFLFNGNGQEEFLAQIERYNKIIKAQKDGITNMPEMKRALEKSNIIQGTNPYYITQEMLENALEMSDKSQDLFYPPIRNQVLENLNAITNPMMLSGHAYTKNEAVLENAIKFQEKLQAHKREIKNFGWEFESKNINPSNNKAYLTYYNEDGDKQDIYIKDIAYGYYGCARIRKKDGTVINSMPEEYWN